MQGTALPPAPWKVAAGGLTQPTAAAAEKRKREDEPEATPKPKQQKIAAVEEMVTDLPLWESSEDEPDF